MTRFLSLPEGPPRATRRSCNARSAWGPRPEALPGLPGRGGVVDAVGRLGGPVQARDGPRDDALRRGAGIRPVTAGGEGRDESEAGKRRAGQLKLGRWSQCWRHSGVGGGGPPLPAANTMHTARMSCPGSRRPQASVAGPDTSQRKDTGRLSLPYPFVRKGERRKPSPCRGLGPRRFLVLVSVWSHRAAFR